MSLRAGSSQLQHQDWRFGWRPYEGLDQNAAQSLQPPRPTASAAEFKFNRGRYTLTQIFCQEEETVGI
jgi:hypothetical protein